MPDNEEIDREEHLFLAGERALATRVLQLLRHSLPDLDQEKVSLVQERARALPMLRELGRLVGDNDWDDNLHLADILDKHILDHLLEGSGATVVPNDPRDRWLFGATGTALNLPGIGQIEDWESFKPRMPLLDTPLAAGAGMKRRDFARFMASCWLAWGEE